MILQDYFQEIFTRQKDNAPVIATTNATERIAKLKKLQKFLLDHVEEACEATYMDFRKPHAETIIGELLVLISEISYTIKNLPKWMRPERQAVPLTMLGTSAYIQYEAKGNVLIMSPWNYPIALAIKPLVSAIAAGCVVMVKPSEMTPHSSAFLRKVLSTVFPPDEVALVEGDAEVAGRLLKLPFNHIFFTGSPAVGKIVMKAAAENLASVTLELGGKSPAIVDASADLEATARRIVWAKFFNNGQTCIAPDYILADHSIVDKLIRELKVALSEMYADVKSSPSYGRIVNHKHFDRLCACLDDALEKGAELVIGGQRDENERFLAPTILMQVNENMKVMQEEIFGPILPIVTFKKLPEAVAFVNNKEKPLALYIHSVESEHIDYVLKNTTSGNALVNEVLTQFGNTEIPFGGVNNSGIGKSNGFYGFKEFSNDKGVMKRRFGTLKFLYPPYSTKLVTLLKKGLRWI